MNKRFLITKKCAECGLMFRTDSADTLICRSCERERLAGAGVGGRRKKQRKKKALPIREVMPLKEFVSALDKYNERHKTQFTYGRAMAAIASGIIDADEFKRG